MVHIPSSSIDVIEEMLRLPNIRKTVDQNVMGKSLGGGDMSKTWSHAPLDRKWK